MSDDDTITVAENYCIACKGECVNEDPADYDHLMADWESISGAWIDRGASAHDVWSFLAAVLLGVARQNNLEWDEVKELLEQAWERGAEGDDDA